MQRKTKTEPWTWIPADPPGPWSSRTLGAVVLVVTCLTLGVMIGRLSLTDRGPRVQSHLPPAVEPAPSSQSQSPPETRPTMALKSDPEPEGKGSSSAAASLPHPAVLLNPGTVKPRSFADESKASIPDAREPVGNATALDQSTEDSKLGNSASVGDPSLRTSANSEGAGKHTRQRALANSRPSRPSEQLAPRTPSPSAIRDYQDLRAYMLAR
jgi:hypothetical protein